MNTNEKIALLREQMKLKGFSAYIVLSQDAHNSEYTPEHWRGRTWLTGFTGSAGLAVITKEKSGLWADGRYFIQAERQISDSEMKLFKMALPGVPTYPEWLLEELSEGDVVGIDGSTITHTEYKILENTLSPKGIKIVVEYDLIDTIWEERPEIPKEKLFIHDSKYCGMTLNEKLNKVRAQIELYKSDYYIVEMLDDIAWLTNLRGNDVNSNPVFVSYMIIGKTNSKLFVGNGKVSEQIKSELIKDNIEVLDYDEFWSELSKLENTKILIEEDRVSEKIYQIIPNNSNKIKGNNIITKLKAIKSDTEIVSYMNSHIKDGVAVVRFMKWLEEEIKHSTLTEIDASDKLEEFRSKQELFMGISFDSIAAYGANAAMMHYKAEPNNTAKLEKKSFFLVDSGGQYLDGTTDITRTIVMGDLTEEEIIDYTLVLKGHIGLAKAKFLAGTKGYNLDILARSPIWNFGIDYKCGTGHGVGFFLNVHEGPQSISQKNIDVALEKGMVVTNEPGIYKENKHGIRIENLYYVKKYVETEFGEFLEFEPLTVCPIDLKAVNVDMLSAEERNWINDYHFMVYDKLSKHLNTEECEWLKAQMPII